MKIEELITFPLNIPVEFLYQIPAGGAAGDAMGRTIYQRSLKEAILVCNAIFAITVGHTDMDTAMKIYQNRKP
jgi:fructose-bisphosphate aldolase/6-deoxy-5-ketofructose 1-phosphate synthase